MKQIADLNRSREVCWARFQIQGAPSPISLFARPTPTAPPSFGVRRGPNSWAGFNRRHIAGRIGVAQRSALLVHLRLREDAASFTSRVWAGWSGRFPARPTVSAFTVGTPVPSTDIENGVSGPHISGIPAAWNARWRPARPPRCRRQSLRRGVRRPLQSAPLRPATRSDRPCWKLWSLPTVAIMRRTPGENCRLPLAVRGPAGSALGDSADSDSRPAQTPPPRRAEQPPAPHRMQARLPAASALYPRPMLAIVGQQPAQGFGAAAMHR